MQIPQDLIETATLKLKSVQSEAEFFQLRAQYLGKKSYVVTAFSKPVSYTHLTLPTKCSV